MPDSTCDSERILREAKISLAMQRDGGTHRLARGSIGRGSAELKRKNLVKRAKGLGLTLLAIMAAAIATGLIIDGIGFAGVMLTAAAVIAAVLFFAFVPRPKVPRRAELKLGNPQQMVARTELWLEAQRPALPPPAQVIVNQLGVQLDALGLQLKGLGDNEPALAEVRELVGEYIPETIDNYRKIPAHLRSEQYAGKTADERLIESLTKLSGEIDRVTRRLAEGALDDLAIKSRYLEYRYGGAEALQGAMPDTGVPLPDFSAIPSKQER
ncbi:hypothetical protein [Erythrobacter tepidarius]|uniref:hypothetical protein n=1 Tax=Erythrobacter tepidarius TaxID=60454 RepID=UPI000A393F0E|nr:hypothetical protein [Erythrobacter tepidarius]